jgi:hypothetical protein
MNMMKKLLFTLIALFTISFISNAQDLTLSWDGVELGESVLIVGSPDDSEIVFHAVVTNNSSDAINVMVVRKQLELLDGAMSQFCWGLCYPPSTDTSGQYILLKSGESSEIEAFSGHYIPMGVAGVSSVEYTFYNMDKPEVSVKVVANYKGSPAGIAEEAMVGGSVSEIYPNPASNFVSLDYELTSDVKQANVKVFNLLGAEVKTANLESNGNKLRMDITDLESGIYFYSVIVNGDVYKTKKLVVQK